MQFMDNILARESGSHSSTLLWHIEIISRCEDAVQARKLAKCIVIVKVNKRLLSTAQVK